MKKMRKIFAVLLTLAMVLGMSMTSFAADAKATITLKNFDTANIVEYMQIIQKDETKTSGWAFTNGAGACFTKAFGLTDSDDLHANNKRTMLTRAKEKILAVDSSKFDQVAFAEIGSLDQITTIVTDAKPETRWLQHFDKIGVKCIYPK